MKVKQRREDFRVEEVNSFQLGDGPFAVYRLEKSGIGTVEAMRIVEQAWALPRSAIRYGGRKDRHAITLQTVTIKGGPRQHLEEQKFSIRYVGQSKREFTAKDIEANRFTITLRGLTGDAAEKISELAMTGVPMPNYFDQQRFGSVGYRGLFAAQAWCLKDYEQAVFLSLAESTPSDSPAEREEKSILRDHWGDWLGAKARLARSNRRSVVTYLVDHPEGFKKAAALIDRDQRSMLVSAFQSKLWNLTASAWIERHVPSVRTIDIAGDTLYLPAAASLETRKLANQAIPLPSARPTRWNPEVKAILSDVCQQFDLKVHQLRFAHPRDVFFSRAERDLLLQPTQVAAQVGIDELDGNAISDDTVADKVVPDGSMSPVSKQRRKVDLTFTLKPGQYATMWIRGLEVLAE